MKFGYFIIRDKCRFGRAGITRGCDVVVNIDVLEVVLCHPGNPATLSSILLYIRKCAQELCMITSGDNIAFFYCHSLITPHFKWAFSPCIIFSIKQMAPLFNHSQQPFFSAHSLSFLSSDSVISSSFNTLRGNYA